MRFTNHGEVLCQCLLQGRHDQQFVQTLAQLPTQNSAFGIYIMTDRLIAKPEAHLVMTATQTYFGERLRGLKPNCMEKIGVVAIDDLAGKACLGLNSAPPSKRGMHCQLAFSQQGNSSAVTRRCAWVGSFPHRWRQRFMRVVLRWLLLAITLAGREFQPSKVSLRYVAECRSVARKYSFVRTRTQTHQTFLPSANPAIIYGYIFATLKCGLAASVH